MDYFDVRRTDARDVPGGVVPVDQCMRLYLTPGFLLLTVRSA